MGNSASEPISMKECQKYGISMDEVREYNQAVSDIKKKKGSGHKIDKQDLDKIHKYCIQKDKERRKKDRRTSSISKASSSGGGGKSVTSKTSRTSKTSAGSGARSARSGLSTEQLQKLLEKQLMLDDPSIMIDDGQHTSAMSSSQNSGVGRFKAVGPPLMIDMSSGSHHIDDVSVMCDPTVAPIPRTADC